VLVRIMRDCFEVYADALSNDPPYSVRFIARPYNSFVPGCRSLKIMAHNRGTRVSPLAIKHLLKKFEINESEFLAALNAPSLFRSVHKEQPPAIQ
jgi:hypothetical protein